MVFSRQEYRSGLPFLSPGVLPHPGIKPRSPATLQGDSLLSEPPEKPLNGQYVSSLYIDGIYETVQVDYTTCIQLYKTTF